MSATGDRQEVSRVKARRRHGASTGPREVPSRRRFVGQGLAFLGASWVAGKGLGGGGAHRAEVGCGETERQPIRPPTAHHSDDRFRDACIRCGLCGIVCENGCIRFFGAGEDKHGILTPYLDLRRRSCTLCMRCTNVCPTGALRPVEDNLETIAGTVDMGTAVVDPDRCLSYLGRICGYCHDACPLPGTAILLTPPGKPVVLEDGCVGCGRCVEMCPQVPTAIDVLRGDDVS